MKVCIVMIDERTGNGEGCISWSAGMAQEHFVLRLELILELGSASEL